MVAQVERYLSKDVDAPKKHMFFRRNNVERRAIVNEVRRH